MKLAWPICHFIGGYGDLLQKVEVLEHPKNETALANLSFYRDHRPRMQNSKMRNKTNINQLYLFGFGGAWGPDLGL